MYSSGTEEYVTRVVEQYSPMLLHLAMTRVNCAADAEDVVQEVFVKLLTARPRFRDGEHERAWLIRATINRACDLRRAAMSKVLPLEEAEEAAAPEPETPQLLSVVQALEDSVSLGSVSFLSVLLASPFRKSRLPVSGSADFPISEVKTSCVGGSLDFLRRRKCRLPKIGSLAVQSRGRGRFWFSSGERRQHKIFYLSGWVAKEEGKE